MLRKNLRGNLHVLVQQALGVLHDYKFLGPLVLMRKFKLTHKTAIEVWEILSTYPGIYKEKLPGGATVLKMKVSDKIIRTDFCRYKYLSKKTSSLATKTFWKNSEIYLKTHYKQLNVKQI